MCVCVCVEIALEMCVLELYLDYVCGNCTWNVCVEAVCVLDLEKHKDFEKKLTFEKQIKKKNPSLFKPELIRLFAWCLMALGCLYPSGTFLNSGDLFLLILDDG